MVQSLEELIEHYVPGGIDEALHVDRRKQIKKMLLKLAQEMPDTFSLAEAKYVCKNWEEILYQRAVFSN